jgi:WD40 repeat protein
MRSNFLGRRLLRCHWNRANSVYEQSSASEDSTFKIWDLSNGACLYTLDVGGSLKQISFDAPDLCFHIKVGTITIDSLCNNLSGNGSHGA